MNTAEITTQTAPPAPRAPFLVAVHITTVFGTSIHRQITHDTRNVAAQVADIMGAKQYKVVISQIENPTAMTDDVLLAQYFGQDDYNNGADIDSNPYYQANHNQNYIMAAAWKQGWLCQRAEEDALNIDAIHHSLETVLVTPPMFLGKATATPPIKPPMQTQKPVYGNGRVQFFPAMLPAANAEVFAQVAA